MHQWESWEVVNPWDSYNIKVRLYILKNVCVGMFSDAILTLWMVEMSFTIGLRGDYNN